MGERWTLSKRTAGRRHTGRRDSRVADETDVVAEAEHVVVGCERSTCRKALAACRLPTRRRRLLGRVPASEIVGAVYVCEQGSTRVKHEEQRRVARFETKSEPASPTCQFACLLLRAFPLTGSESGRRASLVIRCKSHKSAAHLCEQRIQHGRLMRRRQRPAALFG